MNEFTQNIEFYIDQYDVEKQVFKLGEEILAKGFLNKKEFLKICLWKSRRPKRLYLMNSDNLIINNTKQSLKETDELKKIRFLTELKGVSIPTASAILSVVSPKDYPILDERCIQSLNKLELASWKTVSENNWLNYLNIIQDLGAKFNKTAREVEKGLFAFNRLNLDKQYKNLYN